MKHAIRLATLVFFSPFLVSALVLILVASATFTFFDWLITGGEGK